MYEFRSRAQECYDPKYIERFEPLLKGRSSNSAIPFFRAVLREFRAVCDKHDDTRCCKSSNYRFFRIIPNFNFGQISWVI